MKSESREAYEIL
jgi:hypothetical protein